MGVVGRRGLAAMAVVVLLLLARGPLHRATFALPVSNDDAIPLLMARHALAGEPATILWNQPYNGTLDTYLLAPLVAVLSPHHAFRLYEALCGALLVVAIGRLAARAAGERAGWIAAGLAAVGTPYMAQMAALGPTPNFLVPLVVSGVLLAGYRWLDGAPPSVSGALAAGLAAGLVVWDSMLALPALAGAAAGLLLAGLRLPWPTAIALATAAVVGLVPLAVARIAGASAETPVTALRPRWLWAAGLRDLARAAAGLLGIEVPLVIDGPERAALPGGAAAGLAVGLLVLVAAGLARARRRAAPLALWAVALAFAFAASRRTGGDEIRYLYGLAVPAVALAGVGVAALVGRSAALAGVTTLAVAVPWVMGHRALVAAWRDPSHAPRVWQVPRLEPTLFALERAGVRSAYASLQFAGRLALESEERLVVSQAWNERIPGDPLRFRDEVDLDPRAAWVLHPRLSRGMPRAPGLRALLGGMGGAWQEETAGELTVFRDFAPPYDESRPVAPTALAVATTAGVALPPVVVDRDPRTGWVSSEGIARGFGLVLRLDRPRRLDALVVIVDLEPSPLATPWAVSVAGEVVSQGPISHGLQWLNGAPRAGRQAALAVALGGRSGDDVRLFFQEAGPPLGVREVFVYGGDEAPRPSSSAAAAARALELARSGDWGAAAAAYAEAVRQDPERASLHACLLRAEWRAARRRWFDVEGISDGGRPLVDRR